MHWSKSSARKTRKQNKQFIKRDNLKLNSQNIKRDASYKNKTCIQEQAFLPILHVLMTITNPKHLVRQVQSDSLQLVKREEVELQEWQLPKYQQHQELLNLVHALKIRQAKWIRQLKPGCRTNLLLPPLRSDSFNVSIMEVGKEPVLV